MWTVILTVALQIISLVLNKVGADNATKAKFLEFASTIDDRLMLSAKTRESYQAQLERLKNGDPK